MVWTLCYTWAHCSLLAITVVAMDCNCYRRWRMEVEARAVHFHIQLPSRSSSTADVCLEYNKW